jgi:hypothetical protein
MNRGGPSGRLGFCWVGAPGVSSAGADFTPGYYRFLPSGRKGMHEGKTEDRRRNERPEGRKGGSDRVIRRKRI